MVCMLASSDWGPIRLSATGDVKDVSPSVSLLVGSQSNTKMNGERVDKAIAQ